MKKILGGWVLVALVMAAWNGSVYGEDLFRVKGEYWFNKMDGDVKASTNLVPGSELKLVNTLNLDENASVPGLELKLKFGMNKFIGSYWKADYEGQKTITQNIDFGGTSFTTNELVRSELKLEVTSVLYERLFIPEFITKAFPSIAEAEAGLLIGVEYASSEVTLTSSLNTKSEPGAAPIPVVGFFLQVGFLEKVKAEVGAMGFGLSIGDIDARFMDIYAEVKFNILSNLPLGIGYKAWGFNLTDGDTFDINLAVKGFYLVTSYEF
jgi:hypothetical protein